MENTDGLQKIVAFMLVARELGKGIIGNQEAITVDPQILQDFENSLTLKEKVEFEEIIEVMKFRACKELAGKYHEQISNALISVIEDLDGEEGFVIDNRFRGKEGIQRLIENL